VAGGPPFASRAKLSKVARRLFKQLAAIVIGNAIYFLLLTPHLPPAAQHRPDKLDLGLLVDFWICVVVYGIFELIARRRRESSRPPSR
jgi:hypothetical protein